MPAIRRQPKIFLSFAGEDRPVARRLADGLAAFGVRSFVDATSIEVAQNIVEAINRALWQSDYFVLLWSAHTVDRPWVTAEWTAALSRGLNERRAFLHVVRLDGTPLPTILAPQKYLNAFDDWDATVATLARAWNLDRSMGIPVLPPPADRRRDGTPTIDLYVRNRNLSVAHRIPAVPTATTGAQLLDLVSADLRLPERAPDPDGIVATRMSYALEFTGRPVTDKPLTEQGIADDSTIDLLVSGEVVANGQIVTTWILRGPNDHPVYDEPESRAVIDAAFKHLRPS